MTNKTILVLGSTGMAGHMVYYYLENKKKYNIVNVSYRNKLTENSHIIDIKDNRELEQLILKVNPDFIINCIGILIKGSSDAENAIYLNAYFPHFLKEIANKTNAKLIHISTDCVFSGRDGNYKEDSFKDADDVYGRSKALGEINDPMHLTIRTSIIGPELKFNGEGLFHWFMTQHGEVTGFTNVFWGGITTFELAKAIEFFIDNQSVSGIIHLTNGQQISKYDLLVLFKLIWNFQKVIIKEGESVKNVNKSLMKSSSFKFDVPTYENMLYELFKWMEDHQSLYSNYTY